MDWHYLPPTDTFALGGPFLVAWQDRMVDSCKMRAIRMRGRSGLTPITLRYVRPAPVEATKPCRANHKLATPYRSKS